MRILLYTHSLVSDWNHGNAHFLRGVARELVARGHAVRALEPAGGWSRTNLEAERLGDPAQRFAKAFPDLHSDAYGPDFDHEAALDAADVVLVHEWTDPTLVARIGRARRAGGRFTLLFHDTHHRAVSAETDIAGLALDDYDGVLAFGETLAERYRAAGWGRQVHTWHEAADTRLFRPLPHADERDLDLIWIGNWGDDERTAEIDRYLIEPVRRLGLRARVHGVRYPADALDRLADAGIAYAGFLPNTEVPAAFARARATVHIPRRPYVEALPGIPTIRVFEALACGIPLVSAPWRDVEGLFRSGDFLVARDADEAVDHLARVMADPDEAGAIARSGLETILARHTCAHRVDELLAVLAASDTPAARPHLDEALT